MAQEYWLADSEARVVGPIGLDVVTSLHARGKLGDVKSRDGMAVCVTAIWVTVRPMKIIQW